MIFTNKGKLAFTRVAEQSCDETFKMDFRPHDKSILVQAFPSFSVSPSSVVKNVFHTEIIQIKDVDVQLKLGKTTLQKFSLASVHC